MADEKTRKYVVGQKNSSAPILRIPHEKTKLEFRPTEKKIAKTPEKSPENFARKSEKIADFQRAADGSLLIGHEKTPRVSRNFGTENAAISRKNEAEKTENPRKFLTENSRENENFMEKFAKTRNLQTKIGKTPEILQIKKPEKSEIPEYLKKMKTSAKKAKSSAKIGKTLIKMKPIRPAGEQNPARKSAANVIRGQISRIPDQNRALIEREKSRKKAPKFDVIFAKNDVKILPNKNAENPTNFAAIAIAKKRAETAAKKRYRANWRNYYQKFYEQYYAVEMKKSRDAMLKNEARILLEQKKAARAANNQPEFSRNYLGAAAGSATAKLRDPGTIEGEENARASEMNQLRYDILSRMKKHAKKVRKSRHFWPAMVAILAVVLLALIQFNGVIFATIANFVSPGDTSGQEIIIGTGANQPVGENAEIIIPKINVEAPVQYNVADLSEAGAQKALQNGPIHYPIIGATAVPGQLGNTAILGHSSADWFEPGNYKFIFVQLNRLGEGDLFYLDYQGTRYTYRISRTQIIAPNQLGALNLGTDKPYATLITCDPPGTALNRLIVVGEQISPDPDDANVSQNSSENSTATDIVGNPPTLIEKIFGGK